MKKFIVLCFALMLALCACAALAEEGEKKVYVTIDCGEPMMIRYEVTLSDIDGAEKLTTNDALFLAHEAGFEGGAQSGYASGETQYGLSLLKLWGVENGGSYGYYVNNTMALNLTDELNDGDSLVAYVYTDLVNWSDTYCFFDRYETEPGEVTLTLTMIGFDANFAPIELPVEGATICIDGVPTEYVTGEDGSVTFTVTEDMNLITAASETINLVPPVCEVIK